MKNILPLFLLLSGCATIDHTGLGGDETVWVAAKNDGGVSQMYFCQAKVANGQASPVCTEALKLDLRHR